MGASLRARRCRHRYRYRDLLMSEPASYALHVAIQPEGLRDWLAAPCPAPETWHDWENLGLAVSSELFEMATHAAGKPIGELVEELVWDVPGGWHFALENGHLTLVALQGSENWGTHICYLCAFRALGQFGAGPGTAVSHGYIWREGVTDWGLQFSSTGETRLSPQLPRDAQSQLDAVVFPLADAARDGEAGPAKNDLDVWWTR